MRPHERRGVARARSAAVRRQIQRPRRRRPGGRERRRVGRRAYVGRGACAANLRTEAFAGARVFPEAAQFYPAAVTAAMLRASGADYCAPARVLSIGEAAAGGKRVVTTDVGEIEAGVVVVATNAWAPELLPELAGQLSACRNRVIMTAPTAGAWEGVAALGVDSGARELYAIRRADGRICLGGARAVSPTRRWQQRRRRLALARGRRVPPPLPRRMLSKLRDGEGGGEVKIEEEWTGVLGFTPDGRPLCGRVRDSVFVAATGFCGHGMPRCFGAGKAVALMIDGRDDGYTRTCAVTRTSRVC